MTSKLDTLDGLAFFLYRSSAAPGLGGEGLRKILAEARRRNQALGLTGCLHHEDGLFFQWLEGPAPALREVLRLLERDPRHESMEMLDSGPLQHRFYQDWNMRYSDRDQVSLMDWFARSDSSTVDRGDYSNGVAAFLQSLRL